MFTSGKDKSGKEKGGGEEKRKHIKSMIDKIPTSKEELFAYPIDSSLVDNVSVPSNFFVIIIIIIFFLLRNYDFQYLVSECDKLLINLSLFNHI